MNLDLARKGSAVAVAAAVAVALAACGSDNNTGSNDSPAATSTGEAISGNFAGSGASTQQSAFDAWVKGFQATNPDANISYDAKGSGGGRKDVTTGAVVWAGSDAALDDDEEEASTTLVDGGHAFEVPVYISPIAIVYNLPSVSELQLSPDTIANIFAGKITKWNDDAIKADNPDADLPDTAITPFHRSENSGTTTNFTDYLSKASSAWTDEASGDWPTALNSVGQGAKGTSGLVQGVGSAEGAIGYADFSQAGNLGVAKVKVGDSYVAPTPEGAAQVVSDSPRAKEDDSDRIVVDLDRETTDSSHYPLVLVSYAIALTTYEDANDAAFAKAWLTYIISEEGQQAAADASGSAPLSDTLRDEAQKSIDTISAAS